MSTISEFYSGRTLLITGATGFMGKVLLEKLLRSLPNIEKILLLLREKKGVSPADRIKTIVKNPPFTLNANLNRETFEKLRVVVGDITKENLGLSQEDKQMIIDEVSVVFHMAASVRMDLDLKAAIEQNTLSTQRILTLCKEIRNLVSVVHLSTAYCNIDIECMEEKVYEIDVDPYKVMNIIQWLDSKLLKKISDTILGPHPNSYTYSKRLAEIIVRNMGKELPLSIARPSIVIPGLYEPTPGWADTLNGPIGILTACGTGVLRTMLADVKTVPQVVPVDIATNSVIVIAWLRFTQNFIETPVYNITQGDIINMTWEEATEKFRALSLENPLNKILWYPNAHGTKNPLVFKVKAFLYHTVPAYLVDTLLTIFMQEPFLVNVQKRIGHGLKLLSYFALRKFQFKNEKSLQLDEFIPESEKGIFYMYTVDYNVDNYLCNAYEGVKKYSLKEKETNLPLAKFRLKCYWLMDISCKLAILYGFLFIICAMFGVTEILSVSYWFHY